MTTMFVPRYSLSVEKTIRVASQGKEHFDLGIVSTGCRV